MSHACCCDGNPAQGARQYQYAVKVVCGDVQPTGQAAVVALGQYWTAINIHNPDKCREAHFRWKLAVALPKQQGPISPFQRPITLSPDGAIEIDCPEVMQLAFTLTPPPATKFVKGYIVIESDIELDVVAVYTAIPGPPAYVSTMHTERVPARLVPVCEDLSLQLHTGVAPWQTVAPTAGALGPVVPVAHTGWQAPPAGAAWVSQSINDGWNATQVPTTYYYELRFNLCSGFTIPAPFPIQILVDDEAKVFLNTSQIGGTVPLNTPTTLTVPATALNQLHAGSNYFRVEVTNKLAVATGFALAGVLNVIGGKCPSS